MIYKLLNDGLLDAYVAERRRRGTVLESAPSGRPPLRDHVAALLELKWNSPLAQRQAPAPDWPRIAEQFNAYLGPEWPAPPWSGGQAATVAMCLRLAEESTANG